MNETKSGKPLCLQGAFRVNPIQPLTSLRFVAAAMVLAYHVGVLSSGYLGVTFFFMLSGFVLSVSYAGKVGTAREYARFLRKRAVRIYPLHALTILLALPLAATEPLHLLANIFLVHAWLPDRSAFFSVNWVSWTLSAEVFFYATFPITLALVSRYRWRLIWCWASALVCLALLGAGLAPASSHYLFYINPMIRLFGFGLGVALGIAYSAERVFGTRWELAAVAAALLTLAAVQMLPVPRNFGWSLVGIPASAAVIFVFAHGTGLISAWLKHPTLLLLGEASFALYMIHQLAMRYSVILFGESGYVVAAAAAASIPLSILVHRWFDVPINRRLLAARLPKTRAAHPGVAAEGAPHAATPVETRKRESFAPCPTAVRSGLAGDSDCARKQDTAQLLSSVRSRKSSVVR